MNIDTMTRPRTQGQSKELAPPPVDPFSSSSGMYIPPEEIRQSDIALDEIMGWGLSDFQQDTEEEDDELDDNEFDMEFEDAEYPPPIKPENPGLVNGVCNKHMPHLNLNDMQYMPYTPSQQTPSSVAYPDLANRVPIEQTLTCESAPPVKYINPSSLQLPSNMWMNDSQNSMAGQYPGNTPYSNDSNDSISTSIKSNSNSNSNSNSSNSSSYALGARRPSRTSSHFVNTPPSSTGDSPAGSPVKAMRPHSNGSSFAVNPTANFLGNGNNMPLRMSSNTAPNMATGAAVPGNFSANFIDNNNTAGGNSFSSDLSDLTGNFNTQDFSGLASMDLGLSDIDLDMNIDELYPLPELDFPAVSKEHSAPMTPAESGITPPSEPTNLVSPKPAPSLQHIPEIVPRPSPVVEHNVAEHPHNVEHRVGVEPKVEHSTPSPVPVSTQSRRKAPRRKTVSHRPTASSSSIHSTHVCNMTYPDGAECHRSFTRPYDLARHQETLHAAVRKMYTCEVCGENSKTFSRLDALSRHMRLKHS